jgi:hypothetical protein
VSAPELVCPRDSSDTGAFQLSWTAPVDASFRLEERELDGAGGAVTVVYEGYDTATTLTGRPEGSYEYRVATIQPESTQWSVPCVVEVAPPSLGLAFALFGAGLAVTVGTVVAILRGHRAHRRGALG